VGELGEFLEASGGARYNYRWAGRAGAPRWRWRWGRPRRWCARGQLVAAGGHRPQVEGAIGAGGCRAREGERRTIDSLFGDLGAGDRLAGRGGEDPALQLASEYPHRMILSVPVVLVTIIRSFGGPNRAFK
jgi:hypothetical protein